LEDNDDAPDDDPLAANEAPPTAFGGGLTPFTIYVWRVLEAISVEFETCMQGWAGDDVFHRVRNPRLNLQGPLLCMLLTLVFTPAVIQRESAHLRVESSSSSSSSSSSRRREVVLVGDAED